MVRVDLGPALRSNRYCGGGRGVTPTDR